MPTTAPTVAGLEAELLAMVESITGNGGATRDASLLDLGAGSVLIIQLYALIEHSYPEAVTLQEVFNQPSIGSLAECIHGKLQPRGLEMPAPVQEVEL